MVAQDTNCLQAAVFKVSQVDPRFTRKKCPGRQKHQDQMLLVQVIEKYTDASFSRRNTLKKFAAQKFTNRQIFYAESSLCIYRRNIQITVSDRRHHDTATYA